MYIQCRSYVRYRKFIKLYIHLCKPMYLYMLKIAKRLYRISTSTGVAQFDCTSRPDASCPFGPKTRDISSAATVPISELQLWTMAIDIVSFPMNSMVIFHTQPCSAMQVYQRVWLMAFIQFDKDYNNEMNRFTVHFGKPTMLHPPKS